jgi:hypothetical protein
MTSWPIRTNQLSTPVMVQDGGLSAISNLEHKLVVPAAVAHFLDTKNQRTGRHVFSVKAAQPHVFIAKGRNA